MYIITDNKNKITHISETIGYQNNGNVLVDNNSLAIAKTLVKGVYEVENISEGVVAEKYCYTEEKGFYENIDYVEPIDEPTEIEKLKEDDRILQNQVTNLQIALAELVEGGTL